MSRQKQSQDEDDDEEGILLDEVQYRQHHQRHSQDAEYAVENVYDHDNEDELDQLIVENASSSPYQSGTSPPAKVEIQSYSTTYLDGLRGLAAFLVFMEHFTPFYYGPEYDVDAGFGSNPSDRNTYLLVNFPFIRILYTGGNAAVSVFFILSGYVLAKSPLRHIHSVQHRYAHAKYDGGKESQQIEDEGGPQPVLLSLFSATIRRPLRLYIPPTGVALAFATVLHLPFGLAPEGGFVTAPTLLEEYSRCITELVKVLNPFQWHGFQYTVFRYDPVIWTIPIELKGSVLVFGLLALMVLSKRFVSGRIYGLARWIVLGGLTVVLMWTYYWTMACFVAGLILATLDVEFHWNKQQGRSQEETDDGHGHTHGHVRLSMSPEDHLHNKNSSTRTTLFAKLSTATSRHKWKTIIKPLTLHLSFITGFYLLTQPSATPQITRSLNTPGWHYLTLLTPPAYYKDEYFRWYQSIGSFILIYSILRIQRLQNFFNTRPLKFLGKISFTQYLIHFPLLITYGDRTMRLWGHIRKDMQNARETWADNMLRIPDWGIVGFSTRFLIVYLSILPVLLGLSLLGTWTLDRPSVTIGKWVVKMIRLDIFSSSSSSSSRRPNPADTNNDNSTNAPPSFHDADTNANAEEEEENAQSILPISSSSRLPR